MRTFSKIFGMAGMRIGYTMGRPELLAKLKLHDGGGLSGQLPVPSAACAVASLTDKASIAARRKMLMDNRAMTVDFLTKRGLKLIGPSEANMLMIDWKTKSSKEMQAAFRAQGVEIARVFPAWPTVSRISIGSKAGHGRLLRRLQQGRVRLSIISQRVENKPSLHSGGLIFCARRWRARAVLRAAGLPGGNSDRVRRTPRRSGSAASLPNRDNCNSAH